jgi:hypothetical protein
VAWIGHAAVGLMVTRVTGESPLPTPFLLSRVIGDGTALPYLDKVCSNTPYLLCQYRDRFPMTENEFLWSSSPGVGVVGHLDQADRRRLAAEGNAIVVGAVLHDPLRQIGITLANMGRQNVTIGVTRFGFLGGLEPERGPEMSPALTEYRHSAVFQGRMPLQEISWLMTGVYGLAVAGLIALVSRRPRVFFARDDRAVALQLIVAGVLLNACVFGAISSTADRYQGRVAWLIPLLLVVLLWPRAAPSPSLKTPAREEV